MADVFISYAREDGDFVRKLHQQLSACGREVWVDWEGIAPSAKWQEEIEQAIDAADALLFVLSPTSLASEVCAQELEHALASHKRIVPVVADDVVASSVPSALAKLNWIFAREQDDSESAVIAIESALDTDLEHVRMHTRLHVRAREWSQANQEASYTLRGSDLSQAEAWLNASQDLEPRANALQSAYILASRRDSTRRQRIVLGAITVALVVASTLALFAYFENQERMRQQVSRLIADSYRTLNTDPADALLSAHAARNISDTPQVRDALKASYRVLVLHAENRRENAQVTGRGPGYLAGCWKEGDVFTNVSEDGRYTLLATERGTSGANPPGELYLNDNETLRSVKLEHDDGPDYRLEFAGFDRRTQHVFVTRYFNLSIYERDGSRIGGYSLSRFTKSPIHFVTGYIGNQFVIAADCKGGVWLVDPNSERFFELQSEWGKDTLIAAHVADNDEHAVLVFRSGRAVLLWFAPGASEPELTEVPAKGVLYAAMLGDEHSLLVATAGRGGAVATWRVRQSTLAVDRRYEIVGSDLDWVRSSRDSRRLLAVARDHSVHIIEHDKATPIATYDYSDDIDWRSMKRLPREAKPPHGSRLIEVDARRWLIGPKGALLQEAGRLIRITPKFHAVRDVVHAGGQSWILSQAPGPTYRVDGYLTVEVDPALGQVHQIAELHGNAYLATSQGIARANNGEMTRIGGISGDVRELVAANDALWALTGPVFNPGPAYRIDASGATPVPGADAQVLQLIVASDAAWLRTGALGRVGPTYRVRGKDITIVPGPGHEVVALYLAKDNVWLVERTTDKTSALWQGTAKEVEPVAYPGAQVIALTQSQERVWIIAEDGFYRVNALRAERTPDRHLDPIRIVEHADDTWLMAHSGAFRVRDDDIVEFTTHGNAARDIVQVGRDSWLLTGVAWDNGPAYLVLGDTTQPLCRGMVRVASVTVDGNRLRIHTQNTGGFSQIELPIEPPPTHSDICAALGQ